jgi:hydroxymethylbilane synthase
VPDPQELRLGTRGSPLALWQANAVADAIARTGGPRCRIVIIRTSGDHLQNAPLSAVGGKRLFVKEIEDALIRDEIDLAVHSSKDMPAVLPDGLAIAAVLPRADPHDAVVLPASRPQTTSTIGDLVAALGQAPSIGTASVRRVAQLRRLFPGARFMPIRGNLETRLRKLDTGEHDALVLAAAGLRRLGFAARISFTLPASACVPAPGQGIVAVEIREDADAVRRVVAPIDDAAAGAALRAERALVEALGGGCQTPIGAVATLLDGETIEIVAAVVTVDGRCALRATASGRLADAATIGAHAARQLMAEGAGDILAEARQAHAAVEGIQP